ncbi:MAG: tRNA (adenosine(37)-N6)-threonylcarbamoyltransferase complex dimerization subunit type 1 TsaB [Bacteroidales bacterium]|nr:tRNA (adenosine(37)-N6)-threonylcarbamoyltransferase complex dimerization subunit type 1 TsaB [Bacteroidales bacterium]
MSLILGIETATSICSVALVRDGKLLAIRESVGARDHSGALTTYIADVFTEAGLTYSQLDAIAVSMGPGSYTGLRIGVSSAKGFCYALDKPFIAIDTLKSLAWQALQNYNQQRKDTENLLLVPMLDARRMEVYTAVFDQNLQVIEPVNAHIVTENSFDAFAGKEILYFGDGASKCKSFFELKDNYTFLDNINLSAFAICMLAESDFQNNNFADVAYCEPFYLKDFMAGKPRVKGLY